MNHARHRHLSKRLCLGGVAVSLLSTFATADPQTHTAPPKARISIIIDDLGDQYNSGLRAIRLPGQMTYAFLPRTPFSKILAEEAHQLGKEIMIHLPMASIDNHRLGPGGLTMDMSHKQFNQSLQNSLAAIPYAVGLNNHMGSLLTRHPAYMQWLMEAIKEHGRFFYFIDSRTTRFTVAEQIAIEQQVPTRRRDVFLDTDPTPAGISDQFQRLVKRAKRGGSAIAIGHPYETTLNFLEQHLPMLDELGLDLVPTSQLIPAVPATETRMAESPSPHQPDQLVMHNYPQPEHAN